MNRTTKHLLPPYVPPQMTIVPLRTSGMLCLSGGDVYQNAMEVEVLDFFTEGTESENGNLNGQFGPWSDEGGSSFL